MAETNNDEETVSAPPPEMLKYCKMDVRVILTPKELATIKPTTDGSDPLKALISKKTAKQLEGKCSENGYVMPGSVQLLVSGVPTAALGRFTGDMITHIHAKVQVFRPTEDSEVDAVVLQHNSAGLYVRIGGVLMLRIHRDYHLVQPKARHHPSKKLAPGMSIKDFETVRVGDTIRVRILRIRFKHDETYFSGLGELMNIVKRAELTDNSDPYATASVIEPAVMIAEKIVASPKNADKIVEDEFESTGNNVEEAEASEE